MANKWGADNYKGSGLSKGAYEKKYGKVSTSKNDDKKKKEDIKESKKYYSGKESSKKEEAKISTERLQKDIENIMRDAGIADTRATQDYLRNIRNIEENKTADVTELNTYVTTQRGRTQEDLDTSLAKEERRFALESDKINQDLADRGLTFSERKDERIAKESTALTQEEINRAAQRSFQDIANYEAVKASEISRKYGQQEEVANVQKERTLEDIARDKEDAILAKQNAIADVETSLKDSLTDIGYNKKASLNSIEQAYKADASNTKNTLEERAVIG
jgi:hypothetical protein